jgi:hypothetical protein
MVPDGPKCAIPEADQLPSWLITPLVSRIEPVGELLKPPKTRRPTGQGGVVAVASLAPSTEAEPDTSVRSGFLLRQQ